MAKTETLTRLSLVWLQEFAFPFFKKVVNSDLSQKVMETFVTRILLIGIGLVTSVIVARILGPEGRGLYAVALAVGAIGMQFGNLGLHASNTYFVSRDRSLLPFLVSNTLLVSFAFGGTCALLAGIAFTLWPRIAPLQGHLLTLTLISIPVGLAYLLFQNLLIGIQEVRVFNTIELSSKVLSVALITAVILFQRVNVESVFCSQLIALLAALLWCVTHLGRKLSAWCWPSIELLRSHLGYGFRSFLASFGSYLVLRLDLLLVQYILGAKQAGYYSIAGTMADMVYLLPTVTGFILFPKLSAMTNNREKWEFVKKIAALMGGVMMILCGLGGITCKAAGNALIWGTVPPRRSSVYLVNAWDFLLGEFHLPLALSSKHRVAPPSDLYLGDLDINECYIESSVLGEMGNRGRCRYLIDYLLNEFPCVWRLRAETKP